MKYFAFAINEYRYKQISYTVHNHLRQAQISAHRMRGTYKGTPQSDMYGEIIEGLDNFKKWAVECGYDIDFENRILIYKGE
jgi:hypothetical protein